MGGDAGRDGAVCGVDGDGVGRAAGVLGCGGSDHRREVKGVCDGGREGCADEAGGVADHEGHLLGCYVVGGDDEVGFVFAGGFIEDDKEFAIA